MRALPFLFAALAALTAGGAIARADTSATALSDHDVHVLAHVHAVNDMEIRMGRMAVERGMPDVQAYARHLVMDHEKADAQVLALAKQHDLTIPDDVQIGPAGQVAAEVAELQGDLLMTLSGADFDRVYLTMMIAGHSEELAKLDAALMMRGDPGEMALLEQIRPVVAHHADQAKQLLALEKPQ